MNRDWMDRASCRWEDPDLFFSDTDQDREAARQVCLGCPVLAECRVDTLATDTATPIGVRAGLTGSQRRRARLATRPKISNAQRRAAREAARPLFAEGIPLAEIAAQLGVAKRTIGRWQNEFREAA